MGRMFLFSAASILSTVTALAQSCPPPISFGLTDHRTLTASAGGISSGRTYGGVNLGAPASNRTIIVTDGFRDAGSCPLAGMTIGGVAATRVAQQINSVTYTTIVSIWVASVPLGASADIVTTYCANVDSAEGIGVYAAYGLNSTTPTDHGGSNSATNPVINLSSSPGGIGIAVAWGLGQTSAFVPYGSALDYAMEADPTSASQYQFGASANNLGSGFAFSGIYGATSTYEPVAVAATFR